MQSDCHESLGRDLLSAFCRSKDECKLSARELGSSSASKTRTPACHTCQPAVAGGNTEDISNHVSPKGLSKVSSEMSSFAGDAVTMPPVCVEAAAVCLPWGGAGDAKCRVFYEAKFREVH